MTLIILAEGPTETTASGATTAVMAEVHLVLPVAQTVTEVMGMMFLPLAAAVLLATVLQQETRVAMVKKAFQAVVHKLIAMTFLLIMAVPDLAVAERVLLAAEVAGVIP